MPDYGMLSSGLSSFHPLARNPWDLSKNPGGSSAGAGAAAAAGYGPLHLGTDIGGSVRLPAGWCGVFGFKPSLGRIPIKPPYAGRVAGPMTRTVRDAALMMAVLAQPDWRDTMSLPSQDIAWRRPAARPARPAHRPAAGRRLGPGGRAEIAAAVQAAAARSKRPARSSSRCRAFMTRDMADGMDRFWRMRSWLDISALPRERRDQVLPYIRLGRERRVARAARRSSTATARWARCATPRCTACQPFDFVFSPVSPVAAFAAEWPSPTNDPQRPFEHIAFTLPLQHERAAGGIDQLRLHLAAACRSACRSSAGATTTWACCSWPRPANNCARPQRPWPTAG